MVCSLKIVDQRSKVSPQLIQSDINDLYGIFTIKINKKDESVEINFTKDIGSSAIFSFSKGMEKKIGYSKRNSVVINADTKYSYFYPRKKTIVNEKLVDSFQISYVEDDEIKFEIINN